MEQAFRHPFLMHGILLLSALHMALTKSSVAGQSTYRDLNTRQHRAMELYRPELNNITEENSHALFVFSMIVTINAFAFPMIPGPPKDPATILGELVDILIFIRGIMTIHQCTDLWIRNGPIAGLTDRDAPGDRSAPYLDIWEEACGRLAERNQRTDDTEPIKTTNAITIDAMKSSIAGWGRRDGGTSALPFLWPSLIREDTHALLRQHHPMSLVLLAHYGMMLAVCKDRWWIKDWGRQTVWSVAKLIGKDWYPDIAQPLAQCGLDPSDFEAG